jgi:hypothetical protein
MHTTQVAQEVPKEFKVLQNSFEGGFRKIPDLTKLEGNEFGLLINGRCRDGVVKPVQKHLELTKGIPSGKKIQGIYGYDNVILTFAGGEAYNRDLTRDSEHFVKINRFAPMSNTADYLFAAAVPGSFRNRRLSPSGDPIENLDGSPFGIVVQDGINRPQLIDPYGGAGFLQDYEGWNINRREYVPIGRNMVYLNGILYLVAPNKKEIYRSVTGRPLDFMVIIDNAGDKLPTIEEGGAANVSNKVDYEEIVDIQRIHSVNKALLIITGKTSYLTTPNFTSLVYAEPTFDNAFLFSAGSNNPFSSTDIRGDTTMVTDRDVISFNDATTSSNEGRNESFARAVSTIFDEVVQSFTAAVNFNNYGMYGVNTIYGPGILVYDSKIKKWTSLDLLEPAEGFVKQFAISKVNGVNKLYFCTSGNKVFEAYGSSETAICKLYTREWTTEDPQVEVQPQTVNLVFIDVEEEGQVSVTPFVDRRRENTIIENLSGNFTSRTFPVEPPFGNTSKDSSKNLTFTWAEGLRVGWKTGLLIEWNSKATLSHVMLLGSPQTGESSIEQMSIGYS